MSITFIKPVLRALRRRRLLSLVVQRAALGLSRARGGCRLLRHRTRGAVLVKVLKAIIARSEFDSLIAQIAVDCRETLKPVIES